MSDLRDRLQAVLGSAFILERELGGGGMSRVFVAEEVALGRRVVVKVLPPELAGEMNIERFKREVMISARLQHPHIVPILSVGEVDGLPYFTMPYVEGESLRARLAHGELPVAEAVAILRDVAKALESAHSKGVVHRDVKPDNVLLTGGSATVTDFGVAKALWTSTGAAVGGTLTSAGVALGTPAYMAPEQAAADPGTDHRADIYSLGVMAYEMLAGHAPFAGRSLQQLLTAHATEAPVPLTRLRPALPPSLNALVARCTEKRPADRPQSAHEVLQALDAITGDSETASVSATPTTSARWLVLGGIALLLAGAAAVPVLRTFSRTNLDPRRVLVAPFENLTGDSSYAVAGRMASDWIAQGVARLDSVEVVSWSTVLMSASGNTHPDVRQLARELNAGTILSGAIYKQGDSLRFQAQVTDVANGKVRNSIDDVTAPANDPLIGIHTLRERFMGALATTDARGMPLIQKAPRYEAYRELLLGTDRFFHQDLPGALLLFQRAIALDSTFGVAYVMLATANANLGRWRIADSLSRIALRHRDQLGRSERAMLDWQIANIKGDYETTFRIMKGEAARDSGFRPLYIVAIHGTYLNRPHEALRALQAIRKPPSGWVPYYLVYANAYHQIGDFDSELRIADRGDSIYPGALLSSRLRALAAAGNSARVQTLIDSLARVSTDTANTPADMMYATALEFRAHGNPAAASQLLLQARRWLAGRPPEEDRMRRGAVHTTADVLFAMGRFDSAQVRYADLAARDTSDIAARGRMGLTAAMLHDSATARRTSEALGRNRLPYVRGRDTYWRAAIAAALGENERAVNLLKQALGEGISIGVTLHRADEFQSLHGYPPFEMILRPQG